MATLSIKALRQAQALSDHFGYRDREQARSKLRRTIADACIAAEDECLRTKPFPSVYRDLAGLGFRWFKLHWYWFAIEEAPSGMVIANILYEGADMPSRV
jgi:hypothetical protein